MRRRRGSTGRAARRHHAAVVVSARICPMRLLALPLIALLAACSAAPEPEPEAPPALPLFPGETPAIREKIDRWAEHYDLPPTLVHRVVQRESDYRPHARSGPYWGMLQILPATARSMGFDGSPSRLLDADVALKYSLRYLRGAWMVSDGSEHEAMMWYARGYWPEAKRRGLLEETGLRGGLWDAVDAGAAEPPAIDAAGNLLPPEPPCTPRTGLAAALRGSGCPGD
jgi:soluble lytic murein transglycosylase-like protein